MGGWIALGVLVLLCLIPLGVSVIYNTDGPLVRLIAGPVRLTLFPGKKKEPAKKKEKPKKKEKAPKAQKPAQKKPEPSKKGGSFLDFLPLLQVALDLLGDFRRKLRVNRLELKLILAGGDPCDLALNYGKAWAAVGNLMPHLERLFVIKKRDIEVECDFESGETLIYLRLDLTITLGRLLGIVLWHGIRAMIEFIKILNKRKGGAQQ